MTNLPTPGGILAILAGSALLMALVSPMAAFGIAKGFQRIAELLARHAAATSSAISAYGQMWRLGREADEYADQRADAVIAGREVTD